MTDKPNFLGIPILWVEKLGGGIVETPRALRRTKVDELLDEAVSDVLRNDAKRELRIYDLPWSKGVLSNPYGMLKPDHLGAD